MIVRFLSIFLSILMVLVPWHISVSASSVQAPDAVIESLAHQVLADLDQNREKYRKDFSQLRLMVDKYLDTSFDAEYAAQLVLAKNWRDATPDQRKQFIEAFYQSLLQSYGTSLLDFTEDRIKIFPYQGKATDSVATVRSEIRRKNGNVMAVNYTLRMTATGWRIYDVSIEGVSYVKSFRTDFGTEIEQKGLDAVIKRLQTQQSSSASAKKQSG